MARALRIHLVYTAAAVKQEQQTCYIHVLVAWSGIYWFDGDDVFQASFVALQ